ncbi:hypothetical protein NHX12_033886 [Muraenolepis orangiensis]|uniref:Uncharacterized protein n=1 Tax=Muraenolepis orangiensis TaxID=630683 RepID=A0A9Q0E348_9TELE|nr:hypothetical protein NHX12_033886 [Muraenolepis orangiensis]
MSYKIRNGNTSNCGTNPSSAVGDRAGVMVSITRSPREAHGRRAQVEAKKAEPRDSKAPGQLVPGQWGPRGILSTANGWTTQPAQGWQQTYGPQGGYGPPLTAGRANPAQPPSPFNAFLVTTPAGSFAAPQGYPQQGYGATPPFGGAQLGFAPATTPTQDMSKLPTGQPDFPYSQYGYGQDLSAFTTHTFADLNQQTASYGAQAAQATAVAAATAAGAFGRGQNHNVQGFHPYRR